MGEVEIKLGRKQMRQLYEVVSHELELDANDLRSIAAKRNKTVSEYSPSHAMLANTCRKLNEALG